MTYNSPNGSIIYHSSNVRWGDPKPPEKQKERKAEHKKMALFRIEKKSISRGSGHNLVAAIAYRAGQKLTDKNKLNPKATTHDYSKKSDVAHSEIILPSGLDEQLKSKDMTLSFEDIANLVEQGETTKRGKLKKSAKLASEFVIAGSHEVSREQNIKDFQQFAKELAEEQGVIAMVFVHDPKEGNDMRASKGAGDSTQDKDERNIHAHVVLLSRQVDLNALGRLELGEKSHIDKSDTDRKKLGLSSGADWLKGVREQWANIQNKTLRENGLLEVSHLSYKKQGLDIKPGLHQGKNATALKNMGIQTYKGLHNEQIAEHNNVIIKHTTNKYDFESQQAVARANRTTARADKFIDQADNWLSTAHSIFERRKPSPFDTQRAIKELDDQAEEFNRLTEYRDKKITREPEPQHTQQAEQQQERLLSDPRGQERLRTGLLEQTNSNIDKLLSQFEDDDLTNEQEPTPPTPNPTFRP